MTTWVALLCGINVNGQNKMLMGELIDICLGLWPQSLPKTYIASGNLIFEADGDIMELAAKLGGAIRAQFGFEVMVLITEAGKFQKLVRTCPYVGANGKGVHGYFFFTAPDPNWHHIDKLKVMGESIEVYHNIIWLHTPQGIGKSKLATGLAKTLGNAPMTSRSIKTLNKLSEMLDG